MSSLPLSTRSLLELVDLFERSSHSITDMEGRHLHGVPGWDIFGKTSLSAIKLKAWTHCIGYAEYYPVPCGDELVPADLEEDEDPGRYRYRCPETFRLKHVEASMVAVYAIDPAKLLEQMADLLEIAQVLRRGIDNAAIDGVLWKLGEARIGPALTPVWLVRGLASHVETVFDHFMSTTLPEQGMILTTGQPLPSLIRPPRNYRIASIREVLVDYSPKPCIDMSLLERILISAADGVQPRTLALHYDEVARVLTIRTKRDPWHIKGARQAAAVNYMYQQACKDRWMLDASEILAAAYPERKTEENRAGLKMQDLFKGTQWRLYVSNPEKGKYGFNLD